MAEFGEGVARRALPLSLSLSLLQGEEESAVAMQRRAGSSAGLESAVQGLSTPELALLEPPRL
jgi:hypothetical protein